MFNERFYLFLCFFPKGKNLINFFHSNNLITLVLPAKLSVTSICSNYGDSLKFYGDIEVDEPFVKFSTVILHVC